MKLDFSKVQAVGNDFILFADVNNDRLLSADLIRQLCDRKLGVGADGLIRVVKTETMSDFARFLAEDSAAVWFMDYYNRDGSVADICGNGVRAMARFLQTRSLAEFIPGSTVPIATRAGIRDVQTSLDGFSVDLGPWRARGSKLVSVAGLEGAREGVGLDLGNPHLVVRTEGRALERLDLGVFCQSDSRPLEDENIEFYEFLGIRDGVARVRMRVFERGCGETLSCGTGAAAVALVARHRHAREIHHWRVETLGGGLGVRMFPTQEGEHVGLSGPAIEVFRGVGSW